MLNLKQHIAQELIRPEKAAETVQPRQLGRFRS